MATGTMQNELPTQSNAMDPPAEANGLREIRHQFTPNLTSLLAELKASLLISTYQAGKVVVVGVDQGQLSLAYHNFEQAMGLAIGPQGLAVGALAPVHAASTIQFRAALASAVYLTARGRGSLSLERTGDV